MSDLYVEHGVASTGRVVQLGGCYLAIGMPFLQHSKRITDAADFNLLDIAHKHVPALVGASERFGLHALGLELRRLPGCKTASAL